MMSSVQRRSIILKKVNEEGYMQVTVLADLLGVTPTTIRTDLSAMEAEGLLHRTHGSAMAINPVAGERSVMDKRSINSEVKTRIAKAAANMISDSESILMTSGSTVLALCERLNPEVHLDIFTPDLQIAAMLSSNPNITVHFYGGVVHHKSLSTRGEYSFDLMNRSVCSSVFFGADGITPENGITCSTVEEAVFMSHIMPSSLRRVLLCDSSKMGRTGVGRICSLSEIDTLITDKGISESYLKAFEEAGVEVIAV